MCLSDPKMGVNHEGESFKGMQVVDNLCTKELNVKYLLTTAGAFKLMQFIVGILIATQVYDGSMLMVVTCICFMMTWILIWVQFLGLRKYTSDMAYCCILFVELLFTVVAAVMLLVSSIVYFAEKTYYYSYNNKLGAFLGLYNWIVYGLGALGVGLEWKQMLKKIQDRPPKCVTVIKDNNDTKKSDNPA